MAIPIYTPDEFGPVPASAQSTASNGNNNNNNATANNSNNININNNNGNNNINNLFNSSNNNNNNSFVHQLIMELYSFYQNYDNVNSNANNNNTNNLNAINNGINNQLNELDLNNNISDLGLYNRRRRRRHPAGPNGIPDLVHCSMIHNNMVSLTQSTTFFTPPPSPCSSSTSTSPFSPALCRQSNSTTTVFKFPDVNESIQGNSILRQGRRTSNSGFGIVEENQNANDGGDNNCLFEFKLSICELSLGCQLRKIADSYESTSGRRSSSSRFEFVLTTSWPMILLAAAGLITTTIFIKGTSFGK